MWFVDRTKDPTASFTSANGRCSAGIRRFSDADPERARLLHQYALHRSGADAQRLADLQYARAALVEAQDALFQLGPVMPQRSSSALRTSWTIVSSSHWLLKLTPRRHRIHSLPRCSGSD